MADINVTHAKDDAEKEYVMLREEIMYHQDLRDHMAQVTYTVCAAIFAGAITVGNAWVNLCTLIFLIPIALKESESAKTIAYIASYMITFLEEDCGFNWESMHKKYYEKNPRRSIKEYIIHYVSRWDYAILTVASSFLFWIMLGTNPFVSPAINGSTALGVAVLGFQAVAAIFQIVVSRYYCDFSTRKKEMCRNWEKIKAEREATIKDPQIENDPEMSFGDLDDLDDKEEPVAELLLHK